MSKLIEPKTLVGIIAKHLGKMGFRLAYRSGSGTRYLAYPGTPFQLRISDHQPSGYTFSRQAQVVKSVALRAVPMEDTYGLALEFAIGFLLRSDLRRGVLRTAA